MQDEYESLPDLPRFFQTMKAVSEKVVNGERLPLEESSQRKWSPAFSQQDELVQLIRKCFVVPIMGDCPLVQWVKGKHQPGMMKTGLDQ